MKKEELLDYLNERQQKSLKDYFHLENTNLKKIPIKRGDYIKFMYKYNFQFMEGGIIIDINDWPVVRVKSYDLMPTFYKLDLSKVYVFYKKKNIKTKREFFEELLENLEKSKLKKSQ